MNKEIRKVVEKQYQMRKEGKEVKKITLSELRILAKALDIAWKKLCEGNMMRSAFADVGLSLNIDGSEDHRMKFQGQSPGLPSDIII